MEQEITRNVLQIAGMTCTGCEARIENVLKKLDGILSVKAIYSSSNVYVTYDSGIITLNKIIEEIEKLDYKIKNKPIYTQSVVAAIAGTSTEKNTDDGKLGVGQIAGIIVIAIALYVIIKNTVGFNFIPAINQSMGYGILFLTGLLTSLHCVAMCGGVNLSVCVKYSANNGATGFDKLKPSVLYNLGRVVSYTIIGGIVGGIGSVVGFSGTAKGIVAILSGIFMVIVGLNMLNIFPVLRKLNPVIPKIFTSRVRKNSGSRGPLVVGLLNGLMPCGPLQAMQIYALGTGSITSGALSMFLFSLGTVPLMFGFGAVSSFFSSKFNHRLIKVSAVLVLILGFIMLNRGLVLSGINTNNVLGASTVLSTNSVAKVEGNVQVVTTKLNAGKYPPITVQKGIPVKWTISATDSDLNGCNSAINIPEYGIQNKALVPGDNIIEFNPEKEGKYIYTCWMGMISSNITVVNDINSISNKNISSEDNSETQAVPAVGGCCGG
jgi:sulfite exporter TauE/SafE/copper chaperone CopZ